MKTIIFSILLILIASVEASTEASLKQLSKNDRMAMHHFTKKLLEHDHAAHVLCFTNKAICMSSCRLKGPEKNAKDALFLKGWKSFKQHESLFPHPNFILQEALSKDGKYLTIYLINKLALLACLEQHHDLFFTALHLEPSSFLTKLEEGITLKELIAEDEQLLGVLLGYGQESALLFKAEKNVRTKTLPEWRSNYSKIQVAIPPTCTIKPVTFMGNPQSEEVQQLSSIYADELQEFWTIYQQCDSLDLFFSKLCQES